MKLDDDRKNLFPLHQNRVFQAQQLIKLAHTRVAHAGRHPYTPQAHETDKLFHILRHLFFSISLNKHRIFSCFFREILRSNPLRVYSKSGFDTPHA
jgi:hypothetical protein